jgi:ribosomal protein S18 acetylase RimI-like enzyme
LRAKLEAAQRSHAAGRQATEWNRLGAFVNQLFGQLSNGVDTATVLRFICYAQDLVASGGWRAGTGCANEPYHRAGLGVRTSTQETRVGVEAGDRGGWAEWQYAEWAERGYMASMADPAAGDAAAGLGTTVAVVGGGVVWATRDDPTGGFFCRAVGHGVAQPLTADVLDEIVAVATDAGAPVIGLQAAPAALTPEVLELVTARGFAPGRTWDKLYRDATPPPVASTDLRVAAVGPEDADDYAHIVRVGFGMPEQCTAFIAAQLVTPGWQTYGAFDTADGGRLVGVAAMHIDGDLAAMSGAATLPEARGRGAQRALMSRRIDDATAAGVRHFGCETWSEFDGNANPSLHNMHWAGFRTLYRRTNYTLRLTG